MFTLPHARVVLVVFALLCAACTSDQDLVGPDSPRSAGLTSGPRFAASAAPAAVFVQQTASSKCLDVSYELKSPGAQVALWRCVAGATPSQRFTLPTVGDTTEMKVYGSLCLADKGGAGAAGQAIVLATCNGARAQKWTATSAGEVRNAATGACLSTAGGAGSDLTPAVLAACGAPSTRWKNPDAAEVVESAPIAGAPITGAPIAELPGVGGPILIEEEPTGPVFVQQGVSAKCLDVSYASKAVGAQLALWRCVAGSTPSQRFTLPPVGDTTQVKVYGTMCLVDKAGTGAVGSQIVLATCSSVRAQQWIRTAEGELRSLASNACLTTKDHATNDLALAVLGTCGTAYAKWTATVEPSASPTVGAPITEAPIAAPVSSPTATPLPGEVGDPVASATPELPRVTIDTRMPAPTGRTIAVAAGGNLQAALDAAQPGDVITLANGATFRGNFVLGPKASGGWIVVRPASMSGLPAEGERLAPSRHAAVMPKIVSSNAMFAIATPDTYSQEKTQGWRFVGIEIASNEGEANAQTLVELGTSYERTMDAMSSRFIFDRVWIHGRTTQHLHRCLALNVAHAAVVDSYFSDCHTRGQEGQVIGAWQTPGPVKIENNYLEGGTIGVIFGGSDPLVPGMIPSDIEVRGNHFLKPLSWKGVWSVKNSFELKNAQRVLIEGNVFENNWMDAQAGYMILFTALSQGNQALWTTVRDVTFRHNLLRNSAQGFMITARNSYGSNATTLTDVAKRISITHNVLERVGGRTFMVYNETEDITIANNSVSNSEFVSLLLLEDSTKTPAKRLVFRDNLVGRGYMMISGDRTGEGRIALNAYARDAVIAGNLVYSTVAPGAGRTDLYPTTNNFVPDAGLAGITNGTINGIVIPNIAVSPLSAFFRSGTGGSTPGADLAAVARATATAVQR